MPSEKPQKDKCASLITKWKIKYGKKMYCTHPAGWGTNHVGSGRCKLHGGASTGPKRNLKFLETKVWKQEQQALAEYNEMSEENRWDLENPLALCYICLAKAIREKKYWRLVPKLVETIGRTIEKLYHLKYGEKIVIEIRAVRQVVEVVVTAFNECNQLDDANARREVFASIIERGILHLEGTFPGIKTKDGGNGKGEDGGGDEKTTWRLDT